MFTFVKSIFSIMKDRILDFLKAENKSSAQFAEEIGVQPSGISHILSGRNNPSLDFVIKMLDRYKYLSVDWLLFGRGEMYSSNQAASLFDKPVEIIETKDAEKDSFRSKPLKTSENEPESKSGKEIRPLRLIKIVWFYSDNTFREFFPEV